jgi:hypothetical protein
MSRHLRQNGREKLRASPAEISTQENPIWWEFLNKPFTLFVLGSIVLACIGYAFSNYQTCLLRRSADQLSLEKLEFELVSRHRLNGDFNSVYTLQEFKDWHNTDFFFEYEKIAHKWNLPTDFDQLHSLAVKVANEAHGQLNNMIANEALPRNQIFMPVARYRGIVFASLLPQVLTSAKDEGQR